MRLLLVSLGLLVLGAGASHAASSSFQRSCKDIGIEATPSEVYLLAQCKDRGGRYRSAELSLRGYHNDDGYLVRQGYDNSSFQRSCGQYWLDIKNATVVLNGSCRTRDGRNRRARIEVQDIHNDDGRLVGQ